eukprot:1139135-Pelagomonas_calceolata.AAC.2
MPSVWRMAPPRVSSLTPPSAAAEHTRQQQVYTHAINGQRPAASESGGGEHAHQQHGRTMDIMLEGTAAGDMQAELLFQGLARIR